MGMEVVMKTAQPITNQTPDSLPDKLYFRIGEVSKLVGIPTYVLRFWETEFSRIRPKRTAAGQRLYRKKDVELIFHIKSLLYEQRFTIEGAKKHLSATREPGLPEPEITGSITILSEIRRELELIRDLLQ
jgi:DNA-binding transcriptional MerR regulator